jgi:hypothetical protein
MRKMNEPWLHDIYKTGDHDAPEAIKDRNGDVVLRQCRHCGKGEAELVETPDCPWRPDWDETGGFPPANW